MSVTNEPGRLMQVSGPRIVTESLPEQQNLINIGIGESCQADSLTVRWPNPAGDEVSFEGVLANYVVVLDEGSEPSYQSLQEYTGQAASR